DEREFTYEEGHEKGPEHWGELHQNWSACREGPKTSLPLISSANVSEYTLISADCGEFYHPTNATLLNRGHDIMVGSH
ncbi:hypothetical protein KI387_000943, partial [Taxus chinensis]